MAAILPIALTVAIVYWLGVTAETLMGALIRLALPDGVYVPGFGLAAGIVVIFVIGILTRNYLVQALFDWSERIFNRIPIVKSIYGSLKDFADFMSSDPRTRPGRVAILELPGVPGKLIGFLTRESCADLPEEMGGEDFAAVYLPLSYQIGGYTLLVPRASVTPVDMSMEDAMRFALTAGMSVGRHRRADPEPRSAYSRASSE